MTHAVKLLKSWFPHLASPIIFSAPMRPFASDALSIAVSRAQGLGFIGAGYNVSNIESLLSSVSNSFKKTPIPTSGSKILPIGVGALPFGVDDSEFDNFISVLQKYTPAAVWLFAAKDSQQLQYWVDTLRAKVPDTKIAIQVGTVSDALAVYDLVDILILQGSDAGGHGLARSSGITSFIPETIFHLGKKYGTELKPIIAAGGISSGSGIVSALALGTHGVVLGTKFLVAEETNAPPEYKQKLASITDGGRVTVRARVFDDLLNTSNWPDTYDGRAYLNLSYLEYLNGASVDSLKEKLKVADRTKDYDRKVFWVGSSIGLANEIKPAAEILDELRKEVNQAFKRLNIVYSS
ncbi:hypothetical protein V1514DRAFT_324280 [Lipomyces japonicus]|uniref:uncharacterized protein n=1 Tax=Lipomyces japonicus TaxID=56871 RepID=UPI0034D01A40